MDLAMGALSGVADALPGKLGSLLQEEFTLLTGARDDVAFFQAELATMRAAVSRCEGLEEPDGQTRNWVGQVRELAYDIEDWVDLFVQRVDAGGAHSNAKPEEASKSARISRWFHGVFHKVATATDRHAIASELQELRKRVVELSDQRKRYSLGPQVGARHATTVDPRLAGLFVDRASLVGLDGPRDKVADMVTGASSDRELTTVFIVGMAGSGKTTLASEVYRRVSGEFECRASVSAGQRSDLTKVLRDMLSQVDSDYRGRGEAGDVHQLIDRLRQRFQDKRYLIMIDDLWSAEILSTIKCCFPENKLGSRIIITTRIEAITRARCHIYKIPFLNDADAEALFYQKAFCGVGDCPQHLKEVSAQIIKKCGGLPLAIVSVGGMLASKHQTKDEFERSGLQWRELEAMKQIIKLSYNDLPGNLKACLLYLSIFPEKTEIEIERLVMRWVAEGFISEQHGPRAEEIARSYINDLIARSMIQPSQPSHDGTHRSCIVHPVIHEFIVCKSMEDNFVALVHGQQQDAALSNGTVRRLSLLNGSKQDKAMARNDGTKFSHARSITVSGDASATPCLTELSVLRVLDLEGCNGTVCLDGLCKLLLLRYLSLRGTDVTVLPPQIGELRCLETLDVRSTKLVEVLPSILKLEKLTHLLAGNVKLPCGIGKMKSLQTLSGKSSQSVLQELSKMGNLRELELFCDVTEMSGDKKQVMFPGDEFQSLKKLRIDCNLPSVTFEKGALPKVEVLELKFEKGLSGDSSGVSGIEHLASLKHVLVEFPQNDAGAAAIVAAVKNAAETVHPNRPAVTVTVKFNC